MGGMSKRPVEVPDLIGLTFTSARAIGTTAGLVVIGHAPDGAAVSPDSEGIVVEQSPTSPAMCTQGDVLHLRVGRGDGRAKDPEPLEPEPLVRSDLAELADVEGPEPDLALVPA